MVRKVDHAKAANRLSLPVGTPLGHSRLASKTTGDDDGPYFMGTL